MIDGKGPKSYPCYKHLNTFFKNAALLICKKIL